MQISNHLCRNGLVLAVSGFAISTIVSAPTVAAPYNYFADSASPAERPVILAQTTANEMLVEINRLLDTGWQQMKSGQYQSAITSYESAIAYAQNIGAQPQKAEALRGIGAVDALLGDHQQAISAHQQALSIYQSLGHLNSAAAALEDMGNSYLALGDYSQAESHFLQAVDLYRQTGDTASEQYVLSLLDRV